MRGGWLHTQILIEPIRRCFADLGAATYMEYPVKCDGRNCAVDLFVLLAGKRVAVEAELSPDRVPMDILKARALDTDLLYIVTPTRRVALAAKKRGCQPRKRPAIFYITVGQALQQLKRDFVRCFPLCFPMENKSIPQAGPSIVRPISQRRVP